MVHQLIEQDYFCDRTYIGRFAHRYPQRKQFRNKLGTDKDLLDEFLQERTRLIKALAKGG